MATKLDLSGAAPFETPVIVDCLGLAYPLGGHSVQLRFALEGGNELHLPIESGALDKLIEMLAATHNQKKKH